MKNIFLFFLFISQVTIAQRLKKQEKSIIEDLKKTVYTLASDKMEGRRTGSAGEKLAYEYISDQFGKTGLTPMGDDGTFLQAFTINQGKQVLPNSYLKINDTDISKEGFFPFAFSGNGTLKENVSPAFQEKGMPWFWDIKETADNNKENPHFDLREAVYKKAQEFKGKGATGLIVYNSSASGDDMRFDKDSKLPVLNFPVIYIKKNVAQQYLADNTASLDIDLKTAVGNRTLQGHNVVGFLNNKAANTIIIGAHYDHLGFGEDEELHRGDKGEIFNGADDNASGTAAVIELAKYLKDSKFKSNNFLFACFSGEEEGLFGSKYFAKHAPLPLSSVNYMINFDMVGRLNDTSKILTIGGFGTSPSWAKILPAKTKAINVKFDSSGIGPSDHTSFYLENIPVLFFFTGSHKDYHRPTDDADKINYAGELRVIQYVEDVLKETNNAEKLAFSKTREPQMSTAHFTVTLGFMPDYTYEGKGVRTDEIIDGKVAEKAGMKAGDVIISLGDYRISDINSYMEALSKFKEGDATSVTVLRGNEEKKFDIVFK